MYFGRIVWIGLLLPLFIQAQESDSLQKKAVFKLDAELRPRMELRNGYRVLRDDTSRLAFFITQRTRLNISYIHPKFGLVLSVQDVRTWGDSDPRSNKGSTQLFEGYGEWYATPQLTVRLGRQRLMYDNQRLFAQNDWRQVAASHDGAMIRFKNKLLHTELATFFNQSGEPLFGTNYQPVGFSNYKFLGVHFLRIEPHKRLAITTLNAVDGYQDAQYSEKMQVRATSGGRLEYLGDRFYATVSAYYQYGKNVQSQTISAFYVQPEVKYTPIPRFSIRLGAELMSGQNARKTGDPLFRSFVPLYGVAHRFNGFIDQFIAFPNDVNQAGLLNPYLFFKLNLLKNDRLSLQSDWHAFFSANHFVQNGNTISKYLGIENDWLLSFKINDVTQLEWGVSWLLPTESMTIIKKGGTARLVNYWSYLMLTFKPVLFKTK